MVGPLIALIFCCCYWWQDEEDEDSCCSCCLKIFMLATFFSSVIFMISYIAIFIIVHILNGFCKLLSFLDSTHFCEKFKNFFSNKVCQVPCKIAFIITLPFKALINLVLFMKNQIFKLFSYCLSIKLRKTKINVSQQSSRSPEQEQSSTNLEQEQGSKHSKQEH